LEPEAARELRLRLRPERVHGAVVVAVHGWAAERWAAAAIPLSCSLAQKE